MTTFRQALFGEMDASKPQWSLQGSHSWHAQFELAGRPVHVDLDLGDGDWDVRRIQRMLGPLDDVAALDRIGREALRSDLASDRNTDGARRYLEHHVSELAEVALSACFGTADRTAVDSGCFLRALRLVRIGVYPVDPRPHLVLDYTIGKDLTDYVLAVNLDADAQPVGVAMES